MCTVFVRERGEIRNWCREVYSMQEWILWIGHEGSVWCWFCFNQGWRELFSVVLGNFVMCCFKHQYHLIMGIWVFSTQQVFVCLHCCLHAWHPWPTAERGNCNCECSLVCYCCACLLQRALCGWPFPSTFVKNWQVKQTLQMACVPLRYYEWTFAVDKLLLLSTRKCNCVLYLGWIFQSFCF